MISRRGMLAAGASIALTPRALAQETPLRELAAARGILFGTAAATYEMRDADFLPVLARDAAILTPEYEMKRDIIEPRPGVYDFSATDSLLAYSRGHGMAMRGHPLVWHLSNPPWLDDALAAGGGEKLLTGYIAALAGRYRGRLHSLDVVNEALAEDGSGLRPTPWLKALGPRYLDLAFDAARAADPGALRVYNDYGCEAGGNDRQRAQTLKLLDGMAGRGVAVQALGLQGHLSAFGPRVDQKKLGAFLGEIQSRNLKLLVTELDVDDEGGPADFAARDQAVADEASRFLEVVLDFRGLIAVQTWSLSDRYLDPPFSPLLKRAGWQDRRVPYDRGMRKKPLWHALARAFAGARPR